MRLKKVFEALSASFFHIYKTHSCFENVTHFKAFLKKEKKIPCLFYRHIWGRVASVFISTVVFPLQDREVKIHF